VARKTPTYRPVSITIWDDIRFLSLSDSAKLLWLHFLTSSECPIPGVLVASELMVAERMGWTPERVRVTYAELVHKGMSVSWEGRVVWCANGFKHQPVAGPNAIKAMATAWRNIPEVSFKHALWCSFRDATKGWSKDFREMIVEPPRRVIAATSPIDQVPLPLSEPRTPTPSPQGVPPPRTPTGSVQDQDQDQDLEQEVLDLSSSPKQSGGGDLDPRAQAAPKLALVRDPEVLAEYERLRAAGGWGAVPPKGGAA
jgi:hypothetical protein